MLAGLYSAATAMAGTALNQDIVAENLANANVPGYRRRSMAASTFQGTLEQAAGADSDNRLWGTRVSAVYDDPAPGPLEATGNPLDIAAIGNTFFVLDGPNGPVYTRNGTFRLNREGQLESSSGLKVRGEGGAITIPPETSKINITRDGSVTADGEQVGQLALVQIPSLAGMRRVGTTLFEGEVAGGGKPEPGEALCEQGFREGSNVQVVQEMVAMITGMRHYEAAQRALRGLSDALGNNTRPES